MQQRGKGEEDGHTVPHDKLATENATVGVWCLGLHLVLLLLVAATVLLASSRALIISIRVFLLKLHIGFLVIIVFAIAEGSLDACALLAYCSCMDGTSIAGFSTERPQKVSLLIATSDYRLRIWIPRFVEPKS